MDNIKDYRENELKQYVIANLLIVVVFSNLLQQVFQSEDNLYSSIVKTISFSFITSVIYIYVFILDGLVPSTTKDLCVFFRKNKLPGFTIFTDIKDGKVEDMRFSKEKILKFYKETYKEMEQYTVNSDKLKKFENQKWYELYVANKESKMIVLSQRDYLLTRDMYISTITIVILYLFFSKAVVMVNFNIYIFIYFLVMIVITNILSRIKAKRYVLNVIALSVYKKN